MENIIQNFNERFGSTDLFVESNSEQMKKLKTLLGNKVNRILDFYNKYQPSNLPTISGIGLCDIEHIIEENTDLAPGIYLAEYGVYVFATTIGGNALCIDTNDVRDGDASVLIADANFCSFNEDFNCVEIEIAPEEVWDEYDEADDDVLHLNYPNIKKCLPKVENSFLEFIRKLSLNEYENIEKYLEF